MKKAGNALIATVGGREVHPVNVRVGGFYRAPTRAELARARRPARARARDRARDGRLGGDAPVPRCRHRARARRAARPGRLPDGPRTDRLRSTDSTSRPAAFDDHVVEEHVEHSTALHARLRERGSYLTGPLARYSLASDALRPLARDAARGAGLGATCHNPFQSIVVRAVELVAGEPTRRSRSSPPTSEPDAPGGRGRPAAGRRPRRDRGAARPAVPPL